MIHCNDEHIIIKELMDWWKTSKASTIYEASVQFVTILQDVEIMDEIVCLHMNNFKEEILEKYKNNRINLCEHLIDKIKSILDRHKFRILHIMYKNEIYEYIYSFQDMKYKYNTKF